MNYKTVTCGRVSNLLYLAVIAIAILVCFATSAAFADDFRVVTANNSQYSTDLFIASPQEGEVNFDTKFGVGGSHIAAGGTIKVAKFGGDGIHLVTISAPKGARASTYIESRNPAGVFTSFEVASLSKQSGAARLTPLESQTRYTYVVTINEGDKAASMAAKIINAAGVSTGVETWTAEPGVSLYRLAASFDVGSAEIGQVEDCFGGWCSSAPQPVTIFATVNTPAGGAPRVIYPSLAGE